MARRRIPEGLVSDPESFNPGRPDDSMPPQGYESPAAGGRDDSDMGPDDLGDLFALADESFRDAVWYVWRRRLPGESVPARSHPGAPIYVDKIVGAIELDDLKKRIGGGSFRLCGYRNGRKFIERPLEIDGPKKTHETERAAVAIASPSDAPPAILAVLERIVQRLDAPPPVAQTAQGMTFANAIELAKLMRGEPAAPAAPAAVDAMVDMLKQGIELGAGQDRPQGTDWGMVIEKAAPVLKDLVAGLAARRPAAQPRATTPGRPVSTAEVVTDQPESVESVRMAAVVDALSRAVESMGSENEVDPADFAATVETILNPAELSMLRLTTVDGLMSQLAGVSGMFPALATPQARVFIDAVLSELRNPSDEA